MARAVLLLVVLTGPALRPAAAQVEGLTLDATLVVYGDNTEFSNPFRTGQTVLGTFAVAFLEADLSDRLSVRAGGFGNWRFGSERGVDQAKPVLALVIRDGRSRFVLGTLDIGRHLDGSGPDLSGPHRLLPPMQQETLAFERAHEAGMQWTRSGATLSHEAWVNWQRANSQADREVFDAGIATRTRIRSDLAVLGDLHVVHQGGQQGGEGPVADSYAAAAGIEAGGAVGRLERLSLELVALGSRHVPDRGSPERSRSGFGTFVRLAIRNDPWRAHVIMWRADDFIKVEGDPLYQSIRRDGTRFRGLRDYAEVGVSRRFQLAPGSLIETSFRLHRTERYREYSFRILGVARLRVPLRD